MFHRSTIQIEQVEIENKNFTEKQTRCKIPFGFHQMFKVEPMHMDASLISKNPLLRRLGTLSFFITNDIRCRWQRWAKVVPLYKHVRMKWFECYEASLTLSRIVRPSSVGNAANSVSWRLKVLQIFLIKCSLPIGFYKVSSVTSVFLRVIV